MLLGLFSLLLFQLIGEVIARGSGLPIPGPVIGFALLALALAASRGCGGRSIPLPPACCGICRSCSCPPRWG